MALEVVFSGLGGKKGVPPSQGLQTLRILTVP